MSAERELHLQRITTGSRELDTILGGGFPASSINVLMGEPGTGKTILAERLIFANAGLDERPIVYVTTLSEPLDKMVRFLQEFAFFDEAHLTEGRIVYESIAPDLQSEGVAALPRRLRELITTYAPRIIVIDSFKAINDLEPSLPIMRRMLHEVGGLLTAFETTAFLVGEYEHDMISTLPEFALADSVVQLARDRHTDRDERYLRVLKLRGSPYQEGLHAFRISRDGIDVYPRLRSPDAPPGYTARHSRTSTGITGLDAMLSGGMWAGSTLLLMGDTGSGKTTVALQFVLDGIARGDESLYINFQENPTQIERAIGTLGWSLGDAIGKGLHLMYSSPVELRIDSILVELFRLIDAKKIRRVAIDAVGDLLGINDDRRLAGYLYALSQHLIARRISTLMTLETHRGEHALSGRLSAMADTIIRLDVERADGARRRTIEIVKARGTDHALTPHEFAIGAGGVSVK